MPAVSKANKELHEAHKHCQLGAAGKTGKWNEKYHNTLSQRQVQNLVPEHKVFKTVICLHRTEIRFSLRPQGRRCVRHAAPWTGT